MARSVTGRRVRRDLRRDRRFAGYQFHQAEVLKRGHLLHLRIRVCHLAEELPIVLGHEKPSFREVGRPVRRQVPSGVSPWRCVNTTVSTSSSGMPLSRMSSSSRPRMPPRNLIGPGPIPVSQSTVCPWDWIA